MLAPVRAQNSKQTSLATGRTSWNTKYPSINNITSQRRVGGREEVGGAIHTTPSPITVN